MATIPKVKAPRKAAAKKTAEAVQEQDPIVKAVLEMPIEVLPVQQADAPKKPIVYVSIDPGFVALGLAVFDVDTKRFVELRNVNLQPNKDGKVKSAVHHEMLITSVQRMFEDLTSRYNIQKLCVESQIGKFAVVHIQLLVAAQCLARQIPYVYVHPKQKLTIRISENHLKNENISKYHQNKQFGMAQTIAWLESQGGYERELAELTRDQADAVLQLLYLMGHPEKF